MDFTSAAEHVLQFEGGLVDHPKDPGGITKYGISLRAYPELGADGIRTLTKKKALSIYKRDYWDTLRCSELPSAVRLMVFDCAVNQGTHYATSVLQTALAVPVDGILGPVTLKAANTCNTDRVLHRIALNRFLRYRRNHNWDTFGEGWISRLLSTALFTYK